MNVDDFSKWFSEVNGITIKKIEQDRMYFLIHEENLVLKITKAAEESDNFISIHYDKGNIVFCLHYHKLKEFKESFSGKKKSTDIFDLSLATVKQMMEELKTRKNISFAFVMYDHSLPNNISLDASGNPTFICGLLARANYLASKYAEKNMDYEISDEPEEFS